MPFSPTPEREREIAAILSRYPTPKAACIPILHLCQDQQGYVSGDVIDFVSKRLELAPSYVQGAVTFYSLFRTRPAGEHHVWVCRTLSCALRGAPSVLKRCEAKLGIHAGETTKDGKVTLHTAECLASCGTGPMMQVDDRYYENLTDAEVDRILDQLLVDG